MMASGRNDLDFYNVGFAGLFIGLAVLISWLLSLSLGVPLIVSSVRCLVQLQLLRLVLGPVFEQDDQPGLVLLATTAQLLLSAWEVSNRRSAHKGTYGRIFVAMLITVVPISIVASRFAMGEEVWWKPDRYIPMLGMILGNSISALSIGTSHAIDLASTSSSRDKIEALLAHGATSTEACRTFFSESLRLAMLPTINQMSIVGFISIPGMMTGAILGGESVDQAALLQTVILFIISGASGLCSLVAISLTYASLFDAHGRLMPQQPASKRSWNVIQSVKSCWAERKRTRQRGPVHLEA